MKATPDQIKALRKEVGALRERIVATLGLDRLSPDSSPYEVHASGALPAALFEAAAILHVFWEDATRNQAAGICPSHPAGSLLFRWMAEGRKRCLCCGAPVPSGQPCLCQKDTFTPCPQCGAPKPVGRPCSCIK